MHSCVPFCFVRKFFIRFFTRNHFTSNAGTNLLEQRSKAVLHSCYNFKPSVISDSDSIFLEDPANVLPYQWEYMLISRAHNTYSAITLKFDELYIINYVSFNAKPLVWDGCDLDPIKNPYMYVLEVSKDGDKWTSVIDHSICKCYSTQSLYFPRHAAM